MSHEATIQGVGVSVADGGMGAPVVLLNVRDEVILIFVGGDQAREIERAREGLTAERPMTHDLFVNVLDDVGATLDRVRIDDLADETFHAKLDLTVERGKEQEQIVRDARPSDGIALAVRLDCPLLVADDVIDEAGQPPETLGLQEPAQAWDSPAGDLSQGGGSHESATGEPTESENIDLDDAVEIDIGDAEDDDPDDESEFQSD